MYWPTLSFSTWPASRTQNGSVVGLSMHTSQRLPRRAARSPVLRSPDSCSTSPGHSGEGRRPRLNRVTRCPRASAYWTWNGPVKPVPPRIRMSSGFFARSTGADPEAAARPGRAAEAAASAPSLNRSRRRSWIPGREGHSSTTGGAACRKSARPARLPRARMPGPPSIPPASRRANVESQPRRAGMHSAATCAHAHREPMTRPMRLARPCLPGPPPGCSRDDIIVRSTAPPPAAGMETHRRVLTADGYRVPATPPAWASARLNSPRSTHTGTW